MARVLKILGYILVYSSMSVIVVGMVSVLVFQGWGAFTEFMSPFNVWNYLLIFLTLAPGIVLIALAKKMEKSEKGGKWSWRRSP